MTSTPKVVVAVLLLFCAPGSATADEVDEYVARQMRQLHIPGLALAVVREGRIVKSRGYGLANVELNAPVTEDTVFEIGSLTKQFTAAAILMLVEEGKIGLEEPIRKYLSGVPGAWSAVTLRHLLTHSSGIQNYLGVPGLADAAHAAATHDEMNHIFFERLQLEFPPGATWSYSNTGYLLLGSIIEKVSGKPYWQFLEERIFRPLAMSATRSSEPRAILPNRASGYEWAGGRLENRPPLTANAYAAGSLVSTVRDLAKWDAALYTEKLLKKSSLAQAWSPQQAGDGASAPFHYGFGWFVDRYHGRRVIAHSGGTPGFSSFLYRFVDDGLTVIVLTNHADRVIDHLAIDLAGFYVPALARPRQPQPDPGGETSLRLKQALLGLLGGTADPSLFTPALQTFLKTTTGKGLWPWLAADGELEELAFSEAERAGDERILRYRATQGGAARWYRFTVTADGRIAQVYWW